MGLKTGGPVSVNISHCTYAHVKSHLTLRKRVGPMWPVMMDDNASIHERKKNLVETYKKMCSLENRLWQLRYGLCGENNSKNDKNKKRS